MKPSLGYIITGVFVGVQATMISVLGFAPQAVSTTAVTHRVKAPQPAARAAHNPEPITLMFVGDLMLDRHVRERMASSGSEYPFAQLGTVTSSARADLLIGNLEGAISARRPPVKSIDFAFDAAVASLLKRLGFGALSLANNHSLDQGFPGYEDTRRALDAAGLISFGHQVKDDLSPAIMDVQGRRVALLGYNITDNPLDEKAAAAAIRRARADGSLVIVMMHWGVEYDLKHSKAQTAVARRLIDYGADAVIGGHPHVVQGIEIYKGKLIAYSLGNFVFDQYFSEDTQQGIAVALRFGERTTMTVIPIQSVQSQPRRMNVEPARKFLSALLARSVIPKEVLTSSLGVFAGGLNRGELVLTW